jgi:hypothetical protein
VRLSGDWHIRSGGPRLSPERSFSSPRRQFAVGSAVHVDGGGVIG